MTTIAAWLLALVGPLVVRGVIALGFTAVVFTGVTLTANQLVQTAQENWSQMSATVIQLATLSGIPEVLGMLFGAVVAVFTARASVGFAKYVFKK
jgi:hypothetical protein